MKQVTKEETCADQRTEEASVHSFAESESLKPGSLHSFGNKDFASFLGEKLDAPVG